MVDNAVDNEVDNEDNEDGEDNEDDNGGFFFILLYSTGALLF